MVCRQGRMSLIDFTHPEWRALAQQLLSGSPRLFAVVNGSRSSACFGTTSCCWPLAITTMSSPCRAPLSDPGADAGEDGQCPAGTRGVAAIPRLATGERVNERVLAALYRKGRVISAPSSRSTSKTRGSGFAVICPFVCGPHGRSACFSAAAPCWMPPLAPDPGEVALPARTLAQLGKILWGEGRYSG